MAPALLLGAAIAASATGQSPGAEQRQTVTFAAQFDLNPRITGDTGVPRWVGDATSTLIEPIHITAANWPSTLMQMVASGDFPDIMQVTDRTLPDFYGPRGWFVETTAAVRTGRMPNLQRVLRELPQATMRLAPDGRSYVQPVFDTMTRVVPVSVVNLEQELLRAAGYDPENPILFLTVEELLQALVRMKPHFDAMMGEPTYGMWNAGARGIRDPTQLPRSLLLGVFATDTGIRFTADNLYRFGPLEPQFRVGLGFLRTLYANQILHPGYRNMGEKQRRIAQEQGWEMFGYSGMNGEAGEPGWQERLCIATEESPYCRSASYDVWAPLVVGRRPQQRAAGSVGSREWVINARSRAVDAAVKVSDFLYGDLGASLSAFGPEGYAWVTDATPGNFWNRRWIKCWGGIYPEDDCAVDSAGDLTRGLGIGGVWSRISAGPRDAWRMSWADLYLDPLDPTGMKAFRADQRRRQEDVAARYGLVLSQPDPTPRLWFSDVELAELYQLEGRLHAYVDTQIPRFINGQSNLTGEFDAFQLQLEVVGARRLEQIYNNALRRWTQQTGTRFAPAATGF